MKTLVSFKGQLENCVWDFKWEILNKPKYNRGSSFNISLVIGDRDIMNTGQIDNCIMNNLRTFLALETRHD